MSDIKAAGGILRATITITRANGQVEVFELAGAATPEQAAALLRPKVEHGTAGAVVGESAKLTSKE